MSMGASVKTVENRNLASPLGEDYIKMLQGQIDEGAFGTGVGPLQRSAGNSAKQFVQGLENKGGVNTAGLLEDESSKLINAVQTLSARNTNRSAGDLREAFGAAGTGRYGSGILREEGRFREGAGANLDATIAQILVNEAARKQSAREFDVGANQNQLNQLLAGISTLFGMGEANTAEFSKFASQGIVNPDNIVSPGLGSQLLGGGLSFLSSYLSGGGKLPDLGGLFGGGGDKGAFNVGDKVKFIDPMLIPNDQTGGMRPRFGSPA